MKYVHVYVIALVLATSCNKTEFLSKKPNDALVVPTTAADLLALLDNDFVMNGAPSTSGLTPALGDAGSDDYFLLVDDYNTLTDFQKNIYSWSRDIFTGGTAEDISWIKAYKAIFYANVVLDGLNKLDKTSVNLAEWNTLKGSALFFKAYMLWQLAQVYAPTYDSSTAASQLGVPSRFSSDINEPIKRPSLKTNYDEIIASLTEAVSLLPLNAQYKTRPSIRATEQLLARVYLSMSDYDQALVHSDLALKINPTLLDFNTITGTSTTASVMPVDNPEIAFITVQNASSESGSLTSLYAKVDTNLYKMYDAADWRQSYFFRQRVTSVGTLRSFRGTYAGSIGSIFTGLANDEMYLIRAECLARHGELQSSMDDLNALLKNRYKKNQFTNRNASSSEDAVKLVLLERRKELLFRGLRWTDLRRFNKEQFLQKTLDRKVGSFTFTLAPNSSRYTYPIPPSVISFNGEMMQNIRN